MLTLYAHRGCHRSQSVRIALAEVGVAHAELVLRTAATRPTLIGGRSFVPRGLPVVTRGDDLVLWGAASIVFWLASAPASTLMPPTLEGRARAIGWFEWAEAALYEPLARLHHRDLSAKRWGEAKVDELLPDLEAMLPLDDAWLEGAFSIADVAVASPLMAIPPSLLVTAPRLRRYVHRLRRRPSVARVCAFDEDPHAPERPSVHSADVG